MVIIDFLFVLGIPSSSINNFLNKIIPLQNDKMQMTNLLSMLMRLKQACNHPCLVGGLADPELIDQAKLSANLESSNNSNSEVDDLSVQLSSMTVKGSRDCLACFES